MSPRHFHSDWLCMTLLTTTCDVTATLLIDKTNEREVILFNKSSTMILNLINCIHIFVINYKQVVWLLITSIGINSFGFYRAMKEPNELQTFA